jgi:hypothetical protein
MASEDVVYHSKARLILVILGALMFVVVGYWLVSGGARTLQVIGWLSIVFFGACGLYAVLRLISRTPAVIVSAQGIVDHATANSAGLVPWSEIREVKLLSFMNQRYLGVFVHDPAALIAKHSPLKRAALWSNFQFVGTPVVIPRAGLATDLETLERLIRARLPAEARS